jgi:prevent-host-death family protein
LTEARARLGELVDQVRYGGEGVLITKGGKPAAAVVPTAVYEQWMRRRGALISFVEKIRAQVAESGMTEDEIAALVNEAIEEVRAEKAEPTPASESVPN